VTWGNHSARECVVTVRNNHGVLPKTSRQDKGHRPMSPSASAARRAFAAAAVVCTAALATACGSTQNSAGGQAASGGQSATPTSSASSPSASSTPASSATPSSTPGQAGCASAALKVAVDTNGGGAAAGSTFYPLNFTNTGSSSCTLYGYPGVSFTSGRSGSQIGDPASRNPVVHPVTVTLAPGATAHATLQVVDAQNYSASKCHPVTAHWLRVFPPGQTAARYVRFAALVCSASMKGLGSPLSIDAVKGGVGKAGQGL
jgi:hypothetical protein